MKKLTVDNKNKILGWSEGSSSTGIPTNSEIPNYDENTQSLYWENEKVIVKDDNEKIERKKQRLATQYQRDRAVAYPPLADQMDLLYHGGVDALKAELKKTKDAHPKP